MQPRAPSRRRSPPDLPRVEETAAQALSAPRVLTQQVTQYLLAEHAVPSGEVAAWLREKLPGLESYEHDLLLSPLFTPDFETRLRFEPALGESWLEEDEALDLQRRLASRGLRLALLHEADRLEFALPEVLAERFLRLLHLTAEMPLDELASVGSPDAEARCHLRDDAWRRPQSRKLLGWLFPVALRVRSDFPGVLGFLTDFLRSHRPNSAEECIEFMKNLEEALETDLRNHKSGQRSFFDPELKRSYAGKWKVADEIVAEHESMLSTARALRAALANGRG